MIYVSRDYDTIRDKLKWKNKEIPKNITPNGLSGDAHLIKLRIIDAKDGMNLYKTKGINSQTFIFLPYKFELFSS